MDKTYFRTPSPLVGEGCLSAGSVAGGKGKTDSNARPPLNPLPSREGQIDLQNPRDEYLLVVAQMEPGVEKPLPAPAPLVVKPAPIPNSTPLPYPVPVTTQSLIDEMLGDDVAKGLTAQDALVAKGQKAVDELLNTFRTLGPEEINKLFLVIITLKKIGGEKVERELIAALDANHLNPKTLTRVADALGDLKSQNGIVSLEEFFLRYSDNSTMQVAAACALVKIMDSMEEKKFYFDFLVTQKKDPSCNPECKGKIDAALRESTNRSSSEVDGIALAPIGSARGEKPKAAEPPAALAAKKPEEVKAPEEAPLKGASQAPDQEPKEPPRAPVKPIVPLRYLDKNGKEVKPNELTDAEGVIEYSDGSTYAGEITSKGLRSGKGKWANKAGDYIIGQWLRDVPYGLVESFKAATREKYTGEMDNWKREGVGKTEWMNDKSKALRTEEGKYSDDKLVEAKKAAVVVEVSIIGPKQKDEDFVSYINHTFPPRQDPKVYLLLEKAIAGSGKKVVIEECKAEREKVVNEQDELKRAYVCNLPGVSKKIEFKSTFDESTNEWSLWEYTFEGVIASFASSNVEGVYLLPDISKNTIKVVTFKDKTKIFQTAAKILKPQDPALEKSTLSILYNEGRKVIIKKPCLMDGAEKLVTKTDSGLKKLKTPIIARSQNYLCGSESAALSKKMSIQKVVAGDPNLEKYECQFPKGHWEWKVSPRMKVPALEGRDSSFLEDKSSVFTHVNDNQLMSSLLAAEGIYSPVPHATIIAYLSGEEYGRTFLKGRCDEPDAKTDLSKKEELAAGSCQSPSQKIFDFKFSRTFAIKPDGTTTLFSVSDWEGQHGLKNSKWTEPITLKGTEADYTIYDTLQGSTAAKYASAKEMKDDLQKYYEQNLARREERPLAAELDAGLGLVVDGSHELTRPKTGSDIGDQRSAEARRFDQAAATVAPPKEAFHAVNGGLLFNGTLAVYPLGFAETSSHSKAVSIVANGNIGAFSSANNWHFLTSGALGLGTSLKGIVGYRSPIDISLRLYPARLSYDGLLGEGASQLGVVPQWAVGVQFHERFAAEFSCSKWGSGSLPITDNINFCSAAAVFVIPFEKPAPHVEIR